MKTNFKQALMPLAVVVLGVVGAFATNAKKQSEKALIDQQGYVYDNIQKKCIPEVMCSTIVNDICENAFGQHVYGLNSPDDLSTCSWTLYKR